MAPVRLGLLAALVVLGTFTACGAPPPAAPPPPRLAAPPPAPSPAGAPDFAALSSGPSSRFLGVERADARRAPGDPAAALAFAAAALRVLGDAATRPGADESALLLREALGYLDEALARTPPGAKALALETERAAILARSGRAEEAFDLLRKQLDDHPGLLALDLFFQVAADLGRPVDIAAECKRVRPSIRREVEAFALYDRCLAEAREARPERLMPWIPAPELDRYKKDRTERAERDARFHERFDEELRELPPATDAGAPR
ncbi:MAG: hypothetical protein U0359_23235 [Byssovorax sp.]